MKERAYVVMATWIDDHAGEAPSMTAANDMAVRKCLDNLGRLRLEEEAGIVKLEVR